MTQTRVEEQLNKALPEDAISIMEQINAAGYEAFVVGGCVRDVLLGKAPSDWDITTSAKPQEIKKIFRHTIDTGIQHGTVTVLKKHGEKYTGYEVTTYRIDGEYEDARHPKEVTFTGDLSKDLERRDFTINAMAYHPKSGLIDLFGGCEDLDASLIRCVGDPMERFGEDALRMMRAIRFAAQLDATIDPVTMEAIRVLAPTIAKVSAERIQTELVKLMMSDRPADFILFYQSGLSKYFLPEYEDAMVTEQDNPHHCYTVGEHMLHATMKLNLEALAREYQGEEFLKAKRYLRLTMLLHDIAKPRNKTIDEAGIGHFKGHPQDGKNMVRDILQRLKFDNETIHMVMGLTQYHDREILSEDKAMRRAIHQLGEQYFPLIFYVKEADVLAQSDYRRQEKLDFIKGEREIYQLVRQEAQCVNLKDLAVNGADLITAGMKPGKLLGEVLQNMLQEVLDDPKKNDKEYLLKKYCSKDI